MNRKTAADYPPELLDLYDKFAHGQLDRREFLSRASRFSVGGLAAAALIESLMPNYALAQQVDPKDARLKTEYVHFDSPAGNGRTRAYLARPAQGTGSLPGILVVHENRGLNPYIEDVVRRAAVAGYVALGPDALTSLGGYPGNDDEGRTMQAKLDRNKILEDFAAGAKFLKSHAGVNGSVGVVGFCFGGWVCNALAAKLPDVIQAAVPFYGSQVSAEEAGKIKAALLLHYASTDERVNAGWPAYETALKAAGVRYTAHIYEGANHGFHNDTTPRFDAAAAKLAWQRTVEFFGKNLKR